MQRAIFSDKERGMIKDYLSSKFKGEGFRVLKHRVNQNESTIVEDFKLMTEFLLSVDKTKKMIK